MSAELVVHHNAGFFSCCTVRLYKIIEFFNTHKRLPVSIDTSGQFDFFRSYQGEDVNTLFFEVQNNDINYTSAVNFLIQTDENEFRSVFKKTFKQRLINKLFELNFNIVKIGHLWLNSYGVIFAEKNNRTK